MVVFKYFLLIFTIKIILSNPSLAMQIEDGDNAAKTQHQGPQREDFLNQGRYYLINGKNHHGQTPLHLAIVTARFTEKELIFLLGKLVRMRVDLTEKDNKGKTPYDYALNVGYHRLAHRIDELGNNKAREK